MTDSTVIKVGQIWQEVHPNHPNMPLKRVVLVTGPYLYKASRNREFEVFRVTLKTENDTRKTVARSDRFNGKRGGYKLVKDVE